MGGFIHWLFDPSGLTPHGFCLLWRPGLLWTHAIADLTTGAAYVAISLALAVIIRRRKDRLHRPVVWMFITFILLCGLTHWFDILTLWLPLYGAQGVVKAATAAVSVMTAVALWGLLPILLKQPSLEQFQKLNDALRTNLDFLDRIGAIAGVGGWDYDIASDRIIWSAETYRIHGVPSDYEPSLQRAFEFYPPEIRPAIQAAFESGVAERRSWDMEAPFDRADGQRIWVRALGAPVVVDGVLVRINGALQDITDLRNARLALKRESERAVLAADSGGIGIWDWDIVNDQVHWDDRMYRLFGLDTREAIGPVNLFTSRYLHPDDASGLTQALDEALAGRKPFEAEFRIVWDDDSVHHLRATGVVTRDADGRPTRMIGANWDISEPQRLAREMRHRASHDPLTGLVNRGEFEQRLSAALAKAKSDGGQGAMLYIDFDKFKIVNDSCGHSVGDQLLVEVSRILSDSVRVGDTVARLGGDEFGVLLDHCPLGEAQRMAQAICDRMEDFRFVHEDKRFRLGTSIGLAAVDDRWSSAAAIQQAADAACYAAKEAGGNRVHAWLDTDQGIQARKREIQWATRLESALDEDRFTLFHQIIQPLGDLNQGMRMEVLLRMVDTCGALVLPAMFLPAAERFQLASRIDRWVLSRVVGWMSEAPFLDRIEAVNVNLSGQSVGDRSFHRWAGDLLDRAGPTIRQKLGLEITETAVVTNRADAARFITRVREMGCRVALDDFGAGASSFGYLKTLPVDFLKIDGEFIRDLETDPLDAAAVRCFVDVARVLGVRTVAEFVESPGVMALLKQLGVDFVQGNLIHRPAPISEFMALA